MVKWIVTTKKVERDSGREAAQSVLRIGNVFKELFSDQIQDMLTIITTQKVGDYLLADSYGEFA